MICKVMKYIFSVFAVALVFAMSMMSCGTSKRLADARAEGLYGEMLSETDSSTLASLSWRELYTDTCLQRLIETALSSNTDIRIQEWAITQAEATHRATKLAFLPSLTLAPTGGYQYSKNSLLNDGWTYNVPVALDWEIDVFGSLRNQKKMASANLDAARDGMQAVRSRLVANIASLYYQLQAYDIQLTVLDQAINSSNEMTSIAEALMQAGITDAVAVSQFRGNALEYKSRRLEVEHGIEQAELNLCALLFLTPRHIQRTSMLTTEMPEVLATGLSSQLLDNRPDVRRAERQLESYYYGMRKARSDFYPKFTINAKALYNGDFVTGFLGGLTQPLFNRYRTIEAYKHAEAAYNQAKLAYEQRLLDAANEVVVAFTSHRTSHDKYIVRLEQIKEYDKAVTYSREQMLNGNATYLDVLTAQTDLYAKQMSAVADRLEEYLSIVSLYLALGGGTH